MNESKKTIASITSVLITMLFAIGCAQTKPETSNIHPKEPEPEKYIPTQTEIAAESIVDIPFAIYCMCQRQSKEVDNDTCNLYNEAIKYQPVGLVAAYIEKCKIQNK